MVATSTYQAFPSFVTVTVPANTQANALIVAEGDFILNQPAFAQALADVRLTMTNNGTVTQLRFSRVGLTNVGASPISPAPTQWHLSTIQPLTPGTYDFKVEVRQGVINGSGNPITADQFAGSLSVVLFAK
jgi:hypothetical protein